MVKQLEDLKWNDDVFHGIGFGNEISGTIIKMQSPTEKRMSFLLEKANSGKGDSDRHLLTLFSVAASSHSRRILELGVRNGDTTLPLLMAAKINNGVLDSVDLNETSYKAPEDLKSYWQFYKSDAIKFLENSVAAGMKYDLIYLDDWHEYSHVKKELELIDQIVTPSSIVLVHDLMYGNTCPNYHCDLTDCAGSQWAKGGPYRAVAELPGQFWEFSTLPFNNGLTILRKKYSSKYCDLTDCAGSQWATRFDVW